jgi:outer membrane protein assembly factor BamB
MLQRSPTDSINGPAPAVGGNRAFARALKQISQPRIKLLFPRPKRYSQVRFWKKNLLSFMKTRCSLIVVASVAFVTVLSAPLPTARGDWPQWRGPNRTDVSKETGLLQAWPQEGPAKAWLCKDVGLGYSGPAIAQGRLYTMGLRDRIEYLIALDIKDGKELWAAKIGDALKNDWGDGPRGTPAVDGDRVYALGGQGSLICANAADGQVVWQKTMSEFGGHQPGWGYTESVLVDDGKVLCTPGGSKGAILALDKKTGSTIWQSAQFKDGAQYASIIAADHNGARHYIQLTMKHIVGVSAKDGSVLWTDDFPGSVAVIPTPIFHDGHVYVTAGYGVGSKLIKIGTNNQVTAVYFNKVMKNHHGGVILLNGHVYGYSDGPGWVCQNFLSGQEVWAEKQALGKGAIAYADGRFYCLDERNGTVALIEASPDGWKEHGRLKLEPQTTQRSPEGRIWTHPVVADGKLYLRDQELLACYNVKAP